MKQELLHGFLAGSAWTSGLRVVRETPTLAAPFRAVVPLAVKPYISLEESKVLFALLDAADDDGLLRDSNMRNRWRDARARLNNDRYEDEAPLLWELLEELERAQVLEKSWIKDRWRILKIQVERATTLAKNPGSSNSPFFSSLFRN